MVILLDISSFTKIIEKEIKLLDNKTDDEIDIEKMNENKKLLYDYFEKYYNNNIFASNVKSILHNHNLRLNSLIFINEIDYIKHFGYNKIKRIGSGAFGITYLCHKNNKKYAIKLQKHKNEYGNLEKFINNNFREYNNLKKLNKSPCRAFVPKVYDIIFIFDESKPILYSLIIMEFINGITLLEYIDKKGELTITDKKKLDDNIDKLHKFGIFHRDLNSENIMVVKKEKNNNFIFIDYGLSETKKNMQNNLNKLNKIYNNDNKVKNDITINKKLYISINNIIDNKLIVISSFINLIDKETKLLEKKTDEEINDLYKKYIEKINKNKIFLYNFFEKYYKDILFVSNIKSILHANKYALDSLSFIDDIDYIKNFGYNKIKQMNQYGFNETYYIGYKNNKKYEIKFKYFNNEYGNLEYFLESRINEYNNLKKINDYNLSAKVYDIHFIINKLTNKLYSVIVTEYIKGITLQKYIDKKGKLSDNDQKKINDKIAILHKLGIYNFITNSNNIFVVKKGNDYDFIFNNFGLSKNIKYMINKARIENKERLNCHYEKNDTNKNKKLYISINNLIDNKIIDIIL